MSLKSEQQLLDFAKWFNHNKNTITDVKKRTEFAEKACENLGIVMVQMLEDLRVLEGRGPIGKNVSKIITPDNVLGRNNGK